MPQENKNYIYLYTGHLPENPNRSAEIYMMPGFQDFSMSIPSHVLVMVAVEGEALIGGQCFMASVFPEATKPTWEYLRNLEWESLDGVTEVPEALVQELGAYAVPSLESQAWKRLKQPYEDGMSFLTEMQLAVFSGGPTTRDHGQMLLHQAERLAREMDSLLGD